MLFETVDTARRNIWLRQCAPIQECLDWARDVDPAIAPGRYEIRGDDLYVLVQNRISKPREERPHPETHRRYVDLQLCRGGSELIDWYPAVCLREYTAYNEERDVAFFHRPESGLQTLVMTPGTFAVFFPEDAHVPEITDGRNASTDMFVFKIALTLFR